MTDWTLIVGVILLVLLGLIVPVLIWVSIKLDTQYDKAKIHKVKTILIKSLIIGVTALLVVLYNMTYVFKL